MNGENIAVSLSILINSPVVIIHVKALFFSGSPPARQPALPESQAPPFGLPNAHILVLRSLLLPRYS